MREIKFRAWNKDQEIMCYDDEDRTKEYMDGILSTRIGLINSWLSTPEYEFDYRSLYEVMQYTGLKDRNGKEIYEGDIVREPKLNWAGSVMFTGDCQAALKGKSAQGNDEYLMFSQIYLDECEVIGNIYENPELLEGVTS